MGKESLLLGVCRQGLLAIPILLILNHFIGLYGVVSAQLISDAITFIFASVLYNRVYRSLEREANA
jgi:Na+-driven multidrug efflux pump